MSSARATDNPMQEKQLDGVNAIEVCNTMEATKLVYVSGSPNGILEAVGQAPGKYYIIMQPEYAKEFSTVLNKKLGEEHKQLAEDKESGIDRKAAETNLLFTRLAKIHQFEKLDPNEYEVKIYHNMNSDSNTKMIYNAISQFQMDRLTPMRPILMKKEDKEKQKLVDIQLAERIEKRYSSDAISKKLQSGRIAIFVAYKNSDMFATLVINSHVTEKMAGSNRIVYASDLLLASNVISNSEFVTRFMRDVFNAIPSVMPGAEIVTLMAPGKMDNPLVSCVNIAKDVGLCEALNEKNQIELGMFVHFVAPRPASEAKMQVTATPWFSQNGIGMFPSPVQKEFNLKEVLRLTNTKGV